MLVLGGYSRLSSGGWDDVLFGEGPRMAMTIRRVTSGPWISMLDARFGGAPENFMPNYQNALQQLEGDGTSAPPSMAQLAADRVGPEAAGHFNDDWLQNWWPEAQPIEPILRTGLIEAIKRGIAARLPLSAMWVQATDREFEIGIGQSATQITLLIITPPPPQEPGGPPPEPGDTTLVSRRNGQIAVDPLSS